MLITILHGSDFPDYDLLTISQYREIMGKLFESLQDKSDNILQSGGADKDEEDSENTQKKINTTGKYKPIKQRYPQHPNI